MHCWVFTSEKTMSGSLSQAEGLAQALSTETETYYTRVSKPWSWLPIPLQPKKCSVFSCPTTPWPDILIASGKETISPALAVKKANPSTHLIYLQKPPYFSQAFDTIIMPKHDGQLPNAINTLGATHRASLERINKAISDLPNNIKHVNSPSAGILIGGDSRAFKLDKAATETLISSLKSWAYQHDITMILLPSRRTPTRTIDRLTDAFTGTRHILWDQATPSPYLGTLGIVDLFVVTEESVSMTSEAASTGKPIYLFPLTQSKKSKRIQSFQTALIERGIARWFDGTHQNWEYMPLNETERAAKLIMKKITQHSLDK